MSSLIDFVVTASEIEEGRTRKKGKIPISLLASGNKKIEIKKSMAARWTPEEDKFLKDNLGLITDDKIAEELGRTRVSVSLRWKRDLHLSAPSKHPLYITGSQAAHILGIDEHKITHWCDFGLIPHRLMAGKRKIRLIPRISLSRWVITTDNWIYFDWHLITDPHLRRLCELRSKRWGDEWWSSRQVADYHGVTAKDVQRLIYRRELPARQVKTSRGGRHKKPAWLNWYVLRSDAIQAKFLFGRGAGMGWKPTERAEAWMIKARFELGMSCKTISRTMGGSPTHQTIDNWLKKIVYKSKPEQLTRSKANRTLKAKHKDTH